MTEFGNVMFTATTMLLEGYDKVQSLRNVFSSVDGGATAVQRSKLVDTDETTQRRNKLRDLTVSKLIEKPEYENVIEDLQRYSEIPAAQEMLCTIYTFFPVLKPVEKTE